MKYSGKAGFKSESVETRPGTYQNESIERRIKEMYYRMERDTTLNRILQLIMLGSQADFP